MCKMSFLHKKGLTEFGVADLGTMLDNLAKSKKVNNAAVKTIVSEGFE